MAEYKMCANEDMAIYILEFIKRGYEKNFQDAGVQKYIEALQMGIDALGERSHLKAEIEKLNQPILMAENVEINKEEFLEKLQQSPIQPLPIEKHYELRDCPFSPFDEYCTGHCVSCENLSEYLEMRDIVRS